MSGLSALHKRRGVVHASITHLTSRLKDLEKMLTSRQPLTSPAVWRGSWTRSRMHHCTIVDLVDNKETLEREQITLDEHDDVLAKLAAHIEQLVSLSASTSDSSPHRIAFHRLSRLQNKLLPVSKSITSSDGTVNTCLLNQYEEQLVTSREN